MDLNDRAMTRRRSEVESLVLKQEKEDDRRKEHIIFARVENQGRNTLHAVNQVDERLTILN